VVGDAMLFEECKKIGGRVTREGGFCEVGIGGQEIFRGGMEIGEVAAASAGDEDFFADTIGEFDDGDAAAAFASFRGAEKTGSAGAKDEDVKGTGQRGLSGLRLLNASVG